MSAVLETRGLTKSFGALPVARGINIRLEPGARHALIGPNGAGKTSFINLVTGRLAPNSGAVFLRGEDVTRLSQEARVKRGLARTFQINMLFRGLTALENVALAVAERRGLRVRRRQILAEAYELLGSVAMAAHALEPVSRLPYGRQRLIEIAIALGAAPKVLLLDEPAAGVPAAESGIIFDAVERLPPETAVLIIEHDMGLVFRFARRITVLVQGAVLVEGSPAEIAADPRVQEVYLGEDRTLWPAA